MVGGRRGPENGFVDPSAPSFLLVPSPALRLEAGSPVGTPSAYVKSLAPAPPQTGKQGPLSRAAKGGSLMEGKGECDVVASEDPRVWDSATPANGQRRDPKEEVGGDSAELSLAQGPEGGIRSVAGGTSSSAEQWPRNKDSRRPAGWWRAARGRSKGGGVREESAAGAM